LNSVFEELTANMIKNNLLKNYFDQIFIRNCQNFKTIIGFNV